MDISDFFFNKSLISLEYTLTVCRSASFVFCRRCPYTVYLFITQLCDFSRFRFEKFVNTTRHVIVTRIIIAFRSTYFENSFSVYRIQNTTCTRRVNLTPISDSKSPRDRSIGSSSYYIHFFFFV